VLGSSFADDGANDLDPNVARNDETNDAVNDEINHAVHDAVHDAVNDENNLAERRQGAGAGRE
jgi:hypothetical protein